MDSSRVYESIMMNHGIKKIKKLRNQWTKTAFDHTLGLESIIDIEGRDHRQYEFIMQESENIVYDMLKDVIKALLHVHRIEVEDYILGCSSSKSYYYVGKNGELIHDFMDQSYTESVLAFSRMESGERVLYVFKKFGLGNRIPEKIIEGLKKPNHINRHYYVSFVENDAFSEVINHNENESDPTRGTGIYSLKIFFEIFFGEEEYRIFKRYADEFAKLARDFFGFSIVRTLKRNTIHNFRKTILDELQRMDVKECGFPSDFCEEQKAILDNNFYENRAFEILVGTSDFAQSYLTSEWLYSSLSDAGSIDLTSIAMGYFKALEQLLFAYIKQHTQEKDELYREIYIGKGKVLADEKGYAWLNDALMNDPETTKNMSLASLTGFFGYHATDKDFYTKRNQDLLEYGISDQTHEFIIDTLGGMVGLRNEYFHKKNMTDPSEIISIRNSVQKALYLFLGAYRLSENDKKELGVISIEGHDDFYRLCEYIDQKAHDTSSLFDKPIFYFNNDDKHPFTPQPDDDIEYDYYGEPKYSRAQFCLVENTSRRLKLTKDNVRREIWEGMLHIGPSEIVYSGPQRIIFQNGVFAIPPEQES